jgi:hypothetical protein
MVKGAGRSAGGTEFLPRLGSPSGTVWRNPTPATPAGSATLLSHASNWRGSTKPGREPFWRAHNKSRSRCSRGDNLRGETCGYSTTLQSDSRRCRSDLSALRRLRLVTVFSANMLRCVSSVLARCCRRGGAARAAAFCGAPAAPAAHWLGCLGDHNKRSALRRPASTTLVEAARNVPISGAAPRHDIARLDRAMRSRRGGSFA